MTENKLEEMMSRIAVGDEDTLSPRGLALVLIEMEERLPYKSEEEEAYGGFGNGRKYGYKEGYLAALEDLRNLREDNDLDSLLDELKKNKQF